MCCLNIKKLDISKVSKLFILCKGYILEKAQGWLGIEEDTAGLPGGEESTGASWEALPSITDFDWF